MARLRRVTNKIFGSTASTTGDPSTGAEIGQFGSAKAGTYNATSDVEQIQALSAYEKGWIDAVIPNQQYPTLPEMTGVGKVLSYQTGYVMQEGICEWDSGTEYCKNSIVKYVPETITYSASADIGASTGITDASVDVDTFTTQITTDGDYAFTFDGSVWQYEGVTTNLTLYGITYTGTPATDDVITITLTSTIYRGDGTLYISLTDENINNNPSNDSVNWLLYSSGANKDLSNLSATGQAVIDSKVNKTGDTMTGQLAFDKSLNGYASFNINDIPLKTQMDCITNANNLPVANVYGNGCVCVDNNGNYCYREYDRWTTTGQYLKQWIVTCRDANNEAQNAILALSVNTAGKTTFAFPMCDTKATTTSSASNNKVAVVVENYKNGTDWYRVWSDGWIEQGGEVTITASNDYGAISFLKTFSDTNYTLVATGATSYIITTATVIRNIAKTSCRLYIPNLTTGNVPTKWYACGY